MITCTHNECPMNGLGHTGSPRADEKWLSRHQDDEAIRTGAVTKEEMRDRNSYFAVDATIDFGQNDF